MHRVEEEVLLNAAVDEDEEQEELKDDLETCRCRCPWRINRGVLWMMSKRMEKVSERQEKRERVL
jgi:hypothetical protein